MATKMKIEFEGFEEAIARLTKLEGNVRATTEKALKATHAHITPKLHQEMQKHDKYSSGDTEKSIKENAEVKWAGSVGSVEVGFDISDGGLPSVFLMFGTQAHATNHPGTDADKKLHDAVFGNKTKKEIQKIQEDIFYDEIRRLDG